MGVHVGDRVRLVPGSRWVFRVLEVVGAFALVAAELELDGHEPFGVLTATLIPVGEQPG
ncbi:hypothetical protein ABTW96_01320 [Nocardia beijingensis]|uniref:hypothetical protein n=1 Tax=Nocardia beijingensis TaxID=95162 RepID=UPI00331C0508